MTRPTILLQRVFVATKGGIHFTERFPNKDRGLHIETHRVMGGIYEVHGWGGFSCHDIHTKFHKDWFGYPKVDKGEFPDTQTAW
jgi:hypothetical protein